MIRTKIKIHIFYSDFFFELWKDFIGQIMPKRLTYSFVHTTSHGAEREDWETGELIRDLPGAIQDLGPGILCENTPLSPRQWARPIVIAKPGGILDSRRVRQIIQCIIANIDKNQLHLVFIGGNQVRNGRVQCFTSFISPSFHLFPFFTKL